MNYIRAQFTDGGEVGTYLAVALQVQLGRHPEPPSHS